MNCAKSKRSGFTLLEIMVVVTVIGVLLVIAVPGFLRLREASQASRVVNDLRVFSHAIHEYHIVEGLWPHPNENAGEYPDGMDGFLSDNWTRMSPLGGYYFFEHAPGEDAKLVIRSNDINDHLIELIDKKLDDGDPATGLVTGDNMVIALTLL